MSALIRIALLCALASPAFAERVLLADADPELQRAVRVTLAPWKLELLVENEVPSDATHAQMRATVHTARFVVWRENGELIVFDRERGTAEHREAPEGSLDPASAAAAALTVKTLLRLPLEAGTVADTPQQDEPGGTVVAPMRDEEGTELRVQGALATRMTRIEKNAFGARASLAAFVKPPGFPIRFGVMGEVGTTTEIKVSSFRGTWRDYTVIAIASWALPLVGPSWEIEPYVGGGVLRSMLDGEEAMIERHERETLGILRAGTFVRYRSGRFSVGGSLTLDLTPGTPTYTRTSGGSELFEVPRFALALGFLAAADLGP